MGASWAIHVSSVSLALTALALGCEAERGEEEGWREASSALDASIQLETEPNEDIVAISG